MTIPQLPLERQLRQDTTILLEKMIMAKAKAAHSETLNLPEFKLQETDIFLIGESPLIAHAFPEKSRKMMLDKQMKIEPGPRDARDPYAEVEASRYKLPMLDLEDKPLDPDIAGRDGFPAVAFKDAAVTACTSLSDVTKVAARQAFRVAGVSMKTPGVIEDSFVRTALVPLYATAPVIREDVARLSGIGRTPEVRYRPEYPVWGVILPIKLNPGVISIQQLTMMFRAAGHGVGVGDYRPERDGDCGTFDVVSERDFSAWRVRHKI
jgi:hypothetical protein